MVRSICGVLAVAAVFGANSVSVAQSPTHKQARVISIPKQDGIGLQTLALTADGRVAALVAPPRYGARGGTADKPLTSEVRLFDADGVELARWPVGFHAQSIGAGPDGSVFVGGSGRVARFDKDGRLSAEVELPHLAELVKDTEQLRKRAEESVESQRDSYKEIAEQYVEQRESLQKKIDALKEKEPDELTAAQKRRLKRYEEQIEELKQITEQFAVPTVEDAIADLTSRLRMINGVTVTQNDVFIVCGELKGYGYAVWRMDHKFENPKEVLSSLGGCCGQMDVQAHGDELFVAENTKHRVGHYDRDGNRINAFGQKSDQNAEEGFGGCCNPMNLRVGSDGCIYTAESEGIVRCFSPKGEFVDLVGSIKLEHGCKNVAVAVSADGEKVFFCDQPGSRIIVLERDSTTAHSEAGE